MDVEPDASSLWSSLCYEMAWRHPVAVEEVAIYEMLAPAAVVREACRLHDLGFRSWYIERALAGSEATTAFGLAHWIGTRIMHLTPDQMERMPWYRTLKAEVA